MGLFSRKKEAGSATETKAEVASSEAPKALATDHNQSAIIVRPRVTEKAVGQSERNVYTFEVKRDATKFDVRNAIKSLYNVTPVKVNIVNKRPAKRMVGMRNREKHVSGIKKAYVYLKQGDTINLV